jgi:alkylation response protein AidB-like acyl-CoA dehydrogenase
MEASDTAEIAFDNVEIQQNLMGEEEKGFLYYATLCLERLIMAINGMLGRVCN